MGGLEFHFEPIDFNSLFANEKQANKPQGEGCTPFATGAKCREDLHLCARATWTIKEDKQAKKNPLLKFHLGF